ncbi:MAG: aminotransferase class III-fold pyridoxal phosphate-dependent enzyme [Rhodobacteraceae bacterium]|nr:aminotransferase class III-fold pyridoxal phosphate-dependent enzyme [Paracoccaceae bacterium]
MKTVAVIQARMGSTRLPGKVLMPLAGMPAIDLMLARLSRCTTLDGCVVATSTEAGDDVLAAHLTAGGVQVFRGSEKDVLARFTGAAQMAGATTVVRLTGDCPLIDPGVVDRVVRAYHAGDVDYCSNVAPPTYPDGLDTEVFSMAALQQAHAQATAPAHREHVTLYLRETDGIRRSNVAHDSDLSGLRLTLDEQADHDALVQICDHFAPDIHMPWLAVVDAIHQKLGQSLANQATGRNEGLKMGEGQKLWKRAKSVIPGGNMLLSKRAEMFLPDQWPAYFSRTSGCEVWDLDGKRYRDLSLMGVGSNTLGYSHPEVDAAVLQCVRDGNLSTLNAPEEVYLAERLVQMHPWADMARFTRSGGEANAVAIRIARAASGRDGVAICGYHGWHDWYLSANLASDKSLDGHLLPGLAPNGVPRNLAGSVHAFAYNDIAAFKAVIAAHDIGVIKMEVIRNMPPAPGFLEEIRRIATEKGIVLVFDECTSGFRETFGGFHKKYGVEPDMAVFGKTLGNGYAVNAVLGRRAVMEAAQTTFISSTFWTERIGSVAALATLGVMEREKSWEQITATGLVVRDIWTRLGQANGLKINLSGIPSLSSFSFGTSNDLAYKTLLTQEMLKMGWLASTICYTSLAHTPAVLADYEQDLAKVFALVAQCEDGRDVMSLLEGPVCHSGFKRLN